MLRNTQLVSETIRKTTPCITHSCTHDTLCHLLSGLISFSSSSSLSLQQVLSSAMTCDCINLPLPPLPAADLTQSSVIWCISRWCDMLSWRPRGENVFISGHSATEAVSGVSVCAPFSKQSHCTGKTAASFCTFTPWVCQSTWAKRKKEKLKMTEQRGYWVHVWWIGPDLVFYKCPVL